MKTTLAKKIYIIILTLVSLCPLSAYAFERVNISKNDNFFELYGKKIKIFEDRNNRYNIYQVSSVEFDKKFELNKEKVPNFGYTASVIWVKFRIRNNTDDVKEWILNCAHPLIDYITFYQPGDEEKFIADKKGRALGIKDDDTRHGNFIFKINLTPNKTSTYYLKVKSRDGLVIPLKLMSKLEFAKRERREQLYYGMMIGIFVLILLYNFFIYYTSRLRAYLYILFYIISFILFIMSENGMVNEHLWPSVPWLAMNCFPISTALVILSSAFFIQSFLSTRKYTPIMNKVLLLVKVTSVLSLVSTIISPDYKITVIIMITAIVLFAISSTVVGFVSLSRGVRTALYFMISWAFLSVGAFFYSLKTFGILPEMFITHQGLVLGGAIQMIILSFGFAERIKSMNTKLLTLKYDNEKRTKFLEGMIDNAEGISVDLLTYSSEHGNIGENFITLSQDQAALSEEMLATYSELTAAIESINESVKDQESVRKKLSTIIKELQEYQKYVIQTNEAVLTSVTDIFNSTGKTEDNLQQMMNMMNIISEGGQSINNFISIINDITEKINLLSLNASIEAARAGEHGRGFAVVADEIGKLAFATADNAKEISSQLEKIIGDINKGMQIMDETRDSTEGIFQVVNVINEKIYNVTSAMNQQKEKIDEMVDEASILDSLSKVIAVCTNEQKISMQEGGARISELTNFAQEVAESSVKIKEYTKVVIDKANELTNFIKKAID